MKGFSMPRRDEHDVGFGAPEPVKGKIDPEQPPQEPGIFQRVKDGLAERQTRKTYTLPDGRLVTSTTYRLVTEENHQYLGREAFILIKETPGGSLERWRRFRRGHDSLHNAAVRIVMREYTFKAKSTDAGPAEYDQVYMVDGVGGEPKCIGHKPSASLLDRIRRFEGLDPKEEQPTQKDRAVS